MATETKIQKTHGRDWAPEDLAELLGEFVNGNSRRGQEVGEACTRDHRTIQRNIFCLCLDIIEAFAALPATRTDARNERAVKMAKEIVDGYYKGSRPPLV